MKKKILLVCSDSEAALLSANISQHSLFGKQDTFEIIHLADAQTLQGYSLDNNVVAVILGQLISSSAGSAPDKAGRMTSFCIMEQFQTPTFFHTPEPGPTPISVILNMLSEFLQNPDSFEEICLPQERTS